MSERFHASCLTETDEAIRVRIIRGPWESVQWIPKSVICDESEVYGLGHEGALVVASWFVENTKLVDRGRSRDPLKGEAASAAIAAVCGIVRDTARLYENQGHSVCDCESCESLEGEEDAVTRHVRAELNELAEAIESRM